MKYLKTLLLLTICTSLVSFSKKPKVKLVDETTIMEKSKINPNFAKSLYYAKLNNMDFFEDLKTKTDLLYKLNNVHPKAKNLLQVTYNYLFENNTENIYISNLKKEIINNKNMASDPLDNLGKEFWERMRNCSSQACSIGVYAWYAKELVKLTIAAAQSEFSE